MKGMKKAAALLLVLAMVFSLCACGKSELVGTWEGRVDMTELALSEVDEARAQLGSSLSGGRELPRVTDYVESLTIRYTMVFNEDGTYSSQVSQEDIDAMVETLKVGFADYLRQLYFVLLCETLAQMGINQEINSIEELENFLGITMDEAINESLGMSLDEYVQVQVDDSFSEELSTEEFNGSGNFKNKDGKLYLSAGTEYAVDPAYYDLYELEGDTLTLNFGTAPEGDETTEMLYPLVLHKVA